MPAQEQALTGKAPVGIDPRHVHLTQEHFGLLFGAQAKPRRLKGVRQPGYFAGWETVKLIGPKGEIEHARVVHPWRPVTQVEVTRTDAIALGIKAPLRKSGDVAGSAAIILVGPAGTLELKEGCIVAWRHIHMSAEEARSLGLGPNDFVRIKAGDGSGREVIFEYVWVRAAPWYCLEFHLDTDEANAAGLKGVEEIEILGRQEAPANYREFFPEEYETPGWRDLVKK
ncbi:MAG: hypothetical protein HYT79_01805 [Elusimicrobia bacterium]|nr:hypothetical protein [Elusimicrobiota bacterium]